MKLYEISDQMRSLERMFDEDQIDKETFDDTLDSLDADFDSKVEACIKVLKNIESDIEGVAAEHKRLGEKKKALEGRAKSLKSYVAQQITAHRKESIKTGIFNVIYNQGREIVVAPQDPGTLDEKYTYVHTEIKIDKKLMLEDLKKGVEIEHAELGRGEPFITIR